MIEKYVIDENVASKLMSFDASDYGNGKSIELLYGSKFCQVKGLGLLYYNGKFWESNHAEKYLYECAIEMMKIRGSLALNREIEKIQKCVGTDNRRVDGAIKAFLSLPSIAKSIDSFNADKDLINVNNGVLNLRTLEFTDHSPDYNFTYCSNVDWNPDADPSFFLDWLGKCLEGYEDESVREFFQMCLGYSLTGHTREEKLFYVHGEPRAGKGTLVDILRAIMGEKLAGSTKFETFTKKRDGNDQGFDLAPLHACRLVTTSESNRDAKMNEAAVKHVTGNDPVTCAHKNKDMFTFKPQWKIWAFSNFKPNGDVSDDAFWGRMILFSFPHSNLGNEDTTLKDRIVQPDVLEGAFLWIVKGAVKWYQQKRLTPPDAIKNLGNDARNERDYVQQWLDDNCTYDKGNSSYFTPSNKLLSDFKNWCEESGKGEINTTLSRLLIRKGYAEGREYVVTNNFNRTEKKRMRGIYGIKIND